MYHNKYILAVYGNNRAGIRNRILSIVGKNIAHNKAKRCDIYINQVYETGVPDYLVWNGKKAIQLHGIVFPWNCTIDDFAKEPAPCLRKTLKEYEGRYEEIGKGFRNGSYTGIVLDEDSDEFFAFTCFLNTIPIYYCIYDECLIVSSDLYLIGRITDRSLDNVTTGMIEYYIQGLYLTNNSPIAGVSCLAPGAYLRHKNGKIKVDYYYTLPPEDHSLTFEYCLDEFSTKWESNLRGVSSSKYKHGLGLTGGFDSRIILAALEDRKRPLYFTGSSKDHPDFIIASHIARKLELDNHVLEDYAEDTSDDSLMGYADYCVMSDNPTRINSFSYKQQLDFRSSKGLVYELRGGTEFVGGCSYFTERRTSLYAIRKSLPLRLHKYENDYLHFKKLISYALGEGFESDVIKVDKSAYNLYESNLANVENVITKQINPNGSQEAFMERFRCIYIMSNLHIGNALGGRRVREFFAPGICIELMDVAARIPLKHKENRKILFAYLKNFHPELANIVTRGYVFTPSHPWILFKILAPYIVDLNHLGIRIPALQWYLKKEYLKRRSDYTKQYMMQKMVCDRSPIIKDTILGKIYKNTPEDKTRLMRLFNIALLELRMRTGEEGSKQFLHDICDQINIKVSSI